MTTRTHLAWAALTVLAPRSLRCLTSDLTSDLTSSHVIAAAAVAHHRARRPAWPGDGGLAASWQRRPDAQRAGPGPVRACAGSGHVPRV